MWMIVGLGNPGPKYALTRHNIGFLAVDFLARGLGFENFKNDFKADVAKGRWEDQEILLVKPQTFMNLSGTSVQPLMNFYKVDMDHLLVLHDEIDQEFDHMKFHRARGHGGHNGIRNITEVLGSNDYSRLRLGVGRPPHPEMQVADYVLQKFSTEEQNQLPDFLNRAGDAVETFVFEGLQKASSLHNK